MFGTDLWTASLWVALSIIAFVIIGVVFMIARSKDEFTRAVAADLAFYPMIGFYVIWCMLNDSQINYEVALLAGLVGGVLPTMSLARIISKGRR